MRYEWILRHYNLVGGGITAASYDGSVSNQIRHATDRQVHFVLDNYEELSFSLYLDDPMATTIQPMTSVIKLWRNIYNDSGSLIYSDPSYQPCFGGFVTFVEKAGERNIMSVKVFSPLWRLKTRFHIRNHYTKTNPATGNPYTQSELIWQFIQWLQAAFPAPGAYVPSLHYSYMGIEQGNFNWAQDPVMGPYFQGKGANGWANIFDSLMSRAESPELIPRYFHADGSPMVMFLDTDKARGTDKSGSVNFRFHTGSSDNLTDITETIDVQEPGSFANYVWAWGAGGPNSGKLAMAENISDTYGYQNVKVYQHGGYYPDLARFDTTLTKIAEGELKKRRRPPSAYALTVSPAITGPFYGANYSVGDAVSLTASKGALSVNGIKQRIYECALNISDNNVEVSQPLVGHDDKEHIYSS